MACTEAVRYEGPQSPTLPVAVHKQSWEPASASAGRVQVYGADKALPFVVPSPNVRIECPLALVDKVLDARPPAAREAAHAFANSLFTAQAQVSTKSTWRLACQPKMQVQQHMPQYSHMSADAVAEQHMHGLCPVCTTVQLKSCRQNVVFSNETVLFQ